MNSEKGRQIHTQAEHAREDGQFLEALKFTDEAMLAYQADGDQLGFAEVLASRFLTLRHLYEKTGDQSYLILAKYTVMASVEIAEKGDDQSAIALPKFNLAKVQQELGETSKAVESYKQALEIMKTNPPKEHAREGVIADMENHLAIAEYQNGDDTALERAEQAIQRLSHTDEPKYNKDVWMSGGYMRLAEATKNKDYLIKAKEIADTNPDLKLRREQIAKLEQKLS